MWVQYLVTIGAAVSVVASCNYVHFRALRRLARHYSGPACPTKRPMLWIMATIFLLHLLEVGLYAMVIWALANAGFGSMSGAVHDPLRSMPADFYLSISSYTSLGIGDIVPQGSLQVIVGVEALHGLILIAWSASFTYLMMERLWGFSPPAPEPQRDQAGISNERSE